MAIEQSGGLKQSGVLGGSEKTSWLNRVAVLCVLFGIAFQLNIHPIGDGLWYWYGRLFLEHHLLYAGLHLPLQPLFVLLTAYTQALFGIGWLSSKVLALVQLVLFCWGLRLVARRIPWSDEQRGLLLGGAFFLTLTASYFRFDDYHITCYCLEVLAIALLLRLGEEVKSGLILGESALLGILCGLSSANRLNDGGALLAGCAFALAFAGRRLKLAAIGSFAAGAAGAFFGVILLTGDSLREWKLESIVRAAAIKGGTGSVLAGPGRFLSYNLRVVLPSRHFLLNGLLTIVLAFLVVLIRPGPDAATRRVWRIPALGLGLLVVIAALLWQSREGWPDQAIGGYGMLVCFALVAWMLVRVGLLLLHKPQKGWDWREVLVVIPFLQLASGALTAGLSLLEIFPAIAILLLLLPLCAPRLFPGGWRRTALATVACVVIASTAVAKVETPYSWHEFMDRTMFADRVWYQHPVHGEMYIERDQLQLMQHICSTISADGAPSGLLAITNPYANWFCDVPPWHDYVQTWYDTSSRQTIEGLIAELETHPPEWIVYQRSPDAILAHEIVYNRGMPSAHHHLDELISREVLGGKWTIAYRQPFEGADWIVIRTTPAHGQVP